jgi:hypothetical protein
MRHFQFLAILLTLSTLELTINPWQQTLVISLGTGGQDEEVCTQWKQEVFSST